MPTTFTRISNTVNLIVISVCAVLLTAIFVITVIAAANKYLTGASLTWAVGANQSLLPWVGALSTTVALKYGEHIAMSFLGRFIPPGVHTTLRYVNYGLVGLFGVLLAIYGYGFMEASDQMIMISSTIQIPGTWPTAALPVTGVVYCIHLLAGADLMTEHSVMDELDAGTTP